MAKDKKQQRAKRKPAFGRKPQHPERNVYLPTDLQVRAFEVRAQGEISEDEAFSNALSMHPDLEDLTQDNKLPEDMVDGEGNVWSPMMHLNIHAIIECQLAADEPAGIVALATELEERNELDPHEIRHVLAAAIAELMWEMQHADQEFDSARYFEFIANHYDEFVAAFQ